MADEKKLKIVVFGAFGAGKSTMIRALDPESKHIEAHCAGGTTTVALDFGRMRNNGCQIHIYGTPGQERFEFAREIIARGMDGAILLIDVTSPVDDFTRNLSGTLREAKVPFVVFLNRCDGEGADPEGCARLFADAEVIRVSAKDPGQCSEALLKFAATLEPHHTGHSPS